MVKRIFSVCLCMLMVAITSLALAGGVAPYPAPAQYQGGVPYGPPGLFSTYWGDAPFPGLCGGVVALPFLVVGSLLGGNTMAPPPYAPMAYPYRGKPMPPAYYAPPSASILSGVPCLDLCGNLVSGVTGGGGLLY